MNKLLPLILLIVGLTSLATAQTPKKIHDLKSLTDSSGTVHLFYRIYAEYEGMDYFTDHIYHYNTETEQDSLFLEHFYDIRFGFPYSSAVTDYQFLDNDPKNVVLIRRFCDNECSDYVGRKDSTQGMGGLFVSIENLNVEGTDTGRVYVEAFGETIIGRNGGREWPDVDAENPEEIPDSSIFNFPLISLSPYNDSLMFGRKYYFKDSENALLRTTNKGAEIQVLSDTLLPEKVHFDANAQAIYLIDRVNAPGDQCTFETCKYALYRNNTLGDTGNWVLILISETEFIFLPHPNNSGKIYIWSSDQILISTDYGNNFEMLTDPVEDITGVTATVKGDYYSTVSTLNGLKDGMVTEIKSIPVSNEPIRMVPTVMELHQNYPNPFNPTTTIAFTMREAGQVQIDLYSVHGQFIQELINEYKSEGHHSIILNGSALASGVYILRGSLGTFTQSKLITLIK